MKIGENGLSIIKSFEGLRLMPYMDSVGVWTVGYGSTTDVTPGEPITQAEAEDRLIKDVENAEECVNKHVAVPITQNEFDALCSLVFNVGCGNFRKSTMLRLLNEGDHDAAAYEFRRWDKAGGQVLAGLTRRRFAEQQLFERA